MLKSKTFAKARSVLLVTNPLHYQYLLDNFWPEWLYVVASKDGPAAAYYDPATPQVVWVDGDSSLPGLYQSCRHLFPENTRYFSWKTFADNLQPLGNSFHQVQLLENKVAVRSLADSKLFPPHIIVSKDKRPTYKELQEALQTPHVVVQAAVSTGGVGTFIVNNQAEYDLALTAAPIQNQDLVISSLIQGESYGVQCFFDGQQLVFPKYWHKDLVSIEGVFNEQAYTTLYCGAVIENMPEYAAGQMQIIARQVEMTLRQNGYFGIIGLDLVMAKDGKLYLIELNPRLTAVSHVYATLFHAQGLAEDFISTQIKSLLDVASTETFQDWPPLTTPYYYIKLQNLTSEPQSILPACRVGTYDKDLAYKNDRFGIDGLEDPSDVVLIPEVKPGKIVVPGARHISIIGSGIPLDASGKSLNGETRALVQSVCQKFISPS